MHQRKLLSSVVLPCRFVAHRRYPAFFASSSSRRFHESQRWLSSTPNSPPGVGGGDGSGSNPAPGNIASSTLNTDQGLHDNEASAPTTPSAVAKDSGPYGSGVRRALRNRRPGKEKSPPAAVIPDWFHERNTVVNNGQALPGVESSQWVVIDRSRPEAESESVDKQAQGGDGGEEGGGQPGAGESPQAENRYALSEALWEELCASARAGLQLPPAKYAKEPSAKKSHLVLHYPGNDGIVFLDAVVKKLAQELSTDLVTLNAQDIAQLCSEQDLADSGATSPIRSLGYEVYRPSVSETWQDDGVQEGEDDADMVDAGPSRNFRPGVESPKFITIESSPSNNAGAGVPLPNWLGLKSLVASISGPADGSSGGSGSPQSNTDRVESRRLRLLSELLTSTTETPAQPVATEQPASTEDSEPQPQPQPPARDIIIQVQDYGEIQSTREGSRFIYLLQQAIQERRKAGSAVLLIGTAAQDIGSESQDISRLMQNALVTFLATTHS